MLSLFQTPSDLHQYAEKIVSNYGIFLTHFKGDDSVEFTARIGGVNIVNGCRTFKSLRKLSLCRANRCFAEGGSFLAEFKMLQQLDLASTGFSDAVIDFIRSSLRYLNVTQTGITDSGLEILQKLEDLESLNISNCIRITEVGFYHVSNLLGLKVLKV